MAFDQRDKFIQSIVVFTTSEQAQAMSLGDRQTLLLAIRDKYAPDISNEEWAEIAKGINDFKFVITDTVLHGEVPDIESQLPHNEEIANIPEPDNETTDEIDEDEITDANDERYNEPEESDEEIIDKEEGEADDLEEPELPAEEPVKEPETYGRVIKPDKSPKPKIDTSRLKGLLKPKKNG
jgi:hypothetical protein